MLISLSLISLSLIFCFYILYRNFIVRNKMIEMIRLIFKQENYKYYLEKFDKISYDRVLFSFKLIDSFFVEIVKEIENKKSK